MVVRRLLRISLASIFVLCLIPFCVYVSSRFDFAQWGQAGDYVGGVIGTVVAVCTVWLLILTLSSQTKAKNDNFFYYLIQIKDHQVTSLRGFLSNESVQGRDLFRRLVEESRVLYHVYSGDRKRVEDLLCEVLPALTTYLEHNEEIVNYIGASVVDEIGKSPSVNYTKIYIAQLSHEEKIILGYLCALNLIDGYKNFRRFYLDHHIKDKIEYEEALAIYGKKPDAIKEILDLLNNVR